MKNIQNLEMDEELIASPSIAKPESPQKIENGESQNPPQVKESTDGILVTQVNKLSNNDNASKDPEESHESQQAEEFDDKDDSPESSQTKDVKDPDTEEDYPLDNENVITINSIEDALNQKLAELEQEEDIVSEEQNKIKKELENKIEQVCPDDIDDSNTSKKDGDDGDATEDEAVESVDDDDEESGLSDDDANIDNGEKIVTSGDGLRESVTENHETSLANFAEVAKDDDGSNMETEVEEMKTPQKVLNLEEGLMNLNQIMQNFKNLDEETSEEKEKCGLKRSLHTEGNKLAKRTKLEMSFLKKRICKELKRMSRTEIEDLVAEKIVEMISSRSEIGELHQKCNSYLEINDKWRRKMEALQKMCQDLNTVMRRYITDVQKEKEKVAPIKITRSVGLQVLTGHNRQISTPTLMPPQVTAKRTFPMMPPAKPPMIIHTNPAPLLMSMPNGTSITRQTIPANFIQHPIVAPSSAAGSKAPVTVNISPAGMRGLPMANGMPIIRTCAPLPQSDVNKKVIDVVDLDDDDDVTPTMPSQMVIPTGQLRLIPANQLQQQGLAFAVVSSANSPAAGLNRVLIARPQTSGQILVSRNMNGMITRAPQPAIRNSRPVVIQAPPRPVMSHGLRPIAPLMHPAPLPEISQVLQQQNPGWKQSPPKPKLKISRLKTGIVLSWNMDLSLQDHATVTMYQIFAYQETVGLLPAMSLWKKVGDVKALPLPMACTLTQFTKGNKYHFAIRASDVHGRIGLFSDPQSIALT